jgi:hypothetical protein
MGSLRQEPLTSAGFPLRSSTRNRLNGRPYPPDDPPLRKMKAGHRNWVIRSIDPWPFAFSTSRRPIGRLFYPPPTHALLPGFALA